MTAGAKPAAAMPIAILNARGSRKRLTATGKPRSQQILIFSVYMIRQLMSDLPEARRAFLAKRAPAAAARVDHITNTSAKEKKCMFTTVACL
jgi:hypothetical protein